MPGLLGYVHNNNNSVRDPETDLITKMCQSLMHEDWYKTDIVEGEAFAFARVHQNIYNAEPQPIYDENKLLCIFMYGKIYGYENDLIRLEEKGFKFRYRNDPEYCLHLFEEKGVNFVKELNGSFVICIYNFEKNELYLFNDRYGLRPSYYSFLNGNFIFACEIKAILQNKNILWQLDKEALGQFFYYGQLLGETTFIQGVKVLPPASVLVFGNNQLEIRPYWQFLYKENVDISEEEFVKLLVEKWRKAVKIRLQGNHKFGLALSGGLDSRSILAAVPTAIKNNFLTFTFGSTDTGEVRIAKMVAIKSNVTHVAIDIDLKEAIGKYADKAVLINDGMNGIGTSIILSTYEKVRSQIDVCFDGLGGDALLGGGYLSSSLLKINNLADYLEYQKNSIQKKAIYSINELIFLFKNGNEIKTITDEQVNNILPDNLSTTLPNIHDTFMMYNSRVRRHTILGDDQMRSKFEEATPTFDNEFVDVYLQIPAKWRMGHRIYQKFFLELSPELSKIEYLATGLPVRMPLIFWEAGRQYKRVKRKFKKISFIASRGKIKLKETDHGNNLKNWIRSEIDWREYMREKLNNLPDSIFNKKYVNLLVQEHLNNKADNSEKLSRLVSFGVFYSMYMNAQQSSHQ